MNDPIFIGNATYEDLAKSGWKTKKLGSNTALDVNGKPVPGLNPFFVERSEVETRLERYKSENYQIGIEALTKLLASDYSPYRS